jgi:outer membrane lipoprotein-sorting protein
MTKVRNNYSKSSTFESKFTLDIFWSVREKTEKKTGALIIGPRDKFRIELGSDLFVSNGIESWQYNKKTNQVHTNNVKDMDLSSLPSQLFQKYLFNYTYVEKSRNAGIATLVMHPDSSMVKEYTSVIIQVELKSGIINSIKLTDKNDNVQTYTFTKTVFNSKVKSSVFNFVIPKNAEVFKDNE